MRSTEDKNQYGRWQSNHIINNHIINIRRLFKDYLLEREREREKSSEQGGGAEGEAENPRAESLPSTEPKAGLDPRTVRS